MITDKEKAQITALSDAQQDFYASVTFLVITRLRDRPREMVDIGDENHGRMVDFSDDTAREVIAGAYNDLNAWLEEIPVGEKSP